MKALGRAWMAWVELLDRREPGDALALMRIAMGLAVLQTLVTTLWSGLVPVLWYGLEHGGMVPVHDDHWLVRAFGGPSPTLAELLFSLSFLGALSVTLGFGGRLAPLVTAQAMLALKGIYGVQGAYGAILANGLWLLVLADATRTLSLDCRRRTGRWRDDTPVPWWPRLIGIVQLGLIYFSAGVHKLSATWIPGGDMSALYYILQSPNWQRFDLGVGPVGFRLSQLATLLTWLMEVGWPVVVVAVFARELGRPEGRLHRTFTRWDPRPAFMIVGATLHLGVALTMDVGPFLLGTLAFYPAYFTHRELRDMGRRLQGRRAATEASADAAT